GENRRQSRAISDGVAPERLAIAEVSKTSVRAADFGAFEIVNVKVGQQMKAGPQLNQFYPRPFIVGHISIVPRRDQQIKGMVVAAARRRSETRGLRRGLPPERIETKHAAGPRIGVR